MADAVAQQKTDDDWQDITPAQASPSLYSHGNDWQDIPPASLEEFAGPKITETPSYKAGEAIQKWGRETFPVTEEERTAHPYASAIGHTAGAMLPAGVAALTMGPVGALAGAAQMGLSSTADAFDDALAHGADEKTASKAAGIEGAIGTVLGGADLGVVLAPFKRFLPGMTGWAAQKLAQAATSGVTFTGVGQAQQYLNTEVEKELYNPDANYSPEFKDALASFIVGGAMGALHPLRHAQAAGEPGGEAPPLEGEILPPERGPTPTPSLGGAGPTIEGTVNRGAEEAADAQERSGIRIRPTPQQPAETSPEATPQLSKAPDVSKLHPVLEATQQEADEVQTLIDRGADPAEIEAHPLIKRAYDLSGQIPSTNTMPGYGTPEWRANRAFNIGGKEVVGYEAAQDYLTKQAEGYSTNGPVRNERKAAIVIGPGGAGKSTLMEPMARNRYAAIIDADEAKKIFPEYYGGLGGSAVHEESTDVAYGPGSPLDRLISNGGNIIIQKIGHNPNSIRKLRGQLEEDGYTVDLVNVAVPPQEAFRRRIGRFLSTGRFSSTPYHASLAENGDAPSQTYNILKKEGGFGETLNVDGNGPFGRPKPVIDGQGTALAREAGVGGPDEQPRERRGVGQGDELDVRSQSQAAKSQVDLPTRALLEGRNLPYTVEDLSPKSIGADPARFQYKAGADTGTGETKAGAISAEKWTGQYTPAVVWRDNNGANWIVDGHHRLTVGKKLAEGDPNLALKAIVLNERDISAADAKAFGQQRNEARAASRPTEIKSHHVTDASGNGVDVTPLVIEANQAITSQDKGYDASLQPRQRERAASQAQVRDIATNLDPERLGYSAEADRGAPILGPDGMVESGNGRVLAIRRVYEQGGPNAQAYRDWLARQGVDVSKFRNPILVRQRKTALTTEQRRAFTVAANQPTTLAMAAGERAMADARLIDANSLNLIVNPDDLSRNRDFIRRFIGQLPQTEQGAMVGAGGELSVEGATRVRNAVLAKAYGDSGVLARVAESTNDEIKSISNALVAAAPRWAKMRAGIEAGNVRPDVDLTPDLIKAVNITADIRAKNQKLKDYLSQQDAFDKLSDTVEGFIRSFYDPFGTKAAGSERIRDMLRFYADEAAKVSADKGLDLGLVKVEPRDILSLAKKKEWEDQFPLSRPEEPDAGKMLETANKVSAEWQRRLGSDIKVVMGGSLVSRTYVRTGKGEPIDMDVRFLTENPERDYPKVESVTGLKLKKKIPMDNYPSGKSIGYLVEGPITRDGYTFDVEAAVRTPAYAGWARLYPEVMTPGELAAFRADKARLKGGDKESYKALKNGMLKEVAKRVEARGGIRALEREIDGRQGRDAERGGLGNGQSGSARGAQTPGPFLTAGREYTPGESQEGYPEAAERAQRPERFAGPSLPGFEPVSSAEVAKRRVAQPLKPKAEQQPVGGDLFSYQGSQKPLPLEDFVNAVRNGPETSPVRTGTPPVPPGSQTRPTRRATPVKQPDQLSLFGGEPSGGDGARTDVPVPPQQGSQGLTGEPETPSVTKPPDVNTGVGEERPNPPAVISGQREAEQKLAQRSRSNYRITDDDHIGEGGLKTKARQNIDAIRVLKQVEEEGREATPQEKAVMAKYTGWGALAQPMFKESYNREWDNERKELRAVLTEEEYESARASTPNAHYTSPDVIRGMWDAMGHLGFDGGMAIEPSSGVGHFIGLIPDDIAPRTAWTGVELDSITGRIAKTLYGGTEMLVHGFERLKRPSNYYDLAISNVPFGEYHLDEKPYGSHPIHNFFFVKSIDKVRPGGVVAFVTSRYTMDAPKHAGFRRLMAQNSDLVGAIRLPGGKEGAFAGNAGTQVTTDILFLRKKVPGETPFQGGKWTDLKEIQTPEGPTKINEYYADRPHMMLGEMRLLGSQYRSNEPVLVGDPTGLREKIAAAATKEMQPGAFLSRDTPPPPPVHATEIAPGTKEGAFFVQDGKLYQRRDGAGHEHPLPPDEHDKMARLIGMRDLYNELVASQIAGSDPKEREATRAKLRDAYDNFVDAYGPINKEVRTVTKRLTKEGDPVIIARRPNFSLFEEDPDAYKVASIENYDADEDKATRAGVQTKDVIRPPAERQIKTPADALVSSLNDVGRVDLNHVARSLGLGTHEQAITALGDLIYQNPDGRQWETSDRYLSGEVVKKLEDARAIAEDDSSYKRNVAALEKVQPEPLVGSQITAQLGAPWVPSEVFKEFLEEGVGMFNVRVKQIPGSSKWTVEGQWSRDAEAKYGMPNIPERTVVTPIDVADAAFNNRGITVSDRIGSGEDAKWVKNAAATEEARVRVDLMKEAFAGDPEKGIEGWWLGDPERVQRMEAIYNRLYNDTVPWTADGSHLTFPGMNPDFAEAKHRKDVVWRIVKNGNTLVAHGVGGGKTASAIASGMEQKRLGLITKPAYVVPNNLLQQWKDEFWRVYPDANILVADKDEMSKDNRRALLAKIASNDWDGVLITHDNFTRIGISDEYRQQFVRDQLYDLERVMHATEEAEGKKSKTVKQLEKAKKKLEGKLEELMATETKDPGTSFEESGIDFVYLDEAHYYKNLQFPTSMQNVKGLSSSASQRAEDMFMKIRYLEQKRPGRTAVFLTGTPVSNTMAEMWTMQRYLQMGELKEKGLDLFDNWASTFGRVVTRSELSADGRTFKDVASFSRFVNMPELMNLYSQVADTKTAKQMALKLPTPIYHTVKAQLSSEEEKFVQGLVRYAEAMRNKEIQTKPGEPGQVNMASISTAGRKVATDGRLIGRTLTDSEIRARENLGNRTFDFNPRGKIAKSVDNIYRIWQQGNEDLASATAGRAHSIEGLEGDLPGPSKVNPYAMAQLVFLDLGAPKKGKKGVRAEPEEGADPTDEEDFNSDLYADIKKRLVEKGIPAHQIAAIHDAPNDLAKGKQFAKVNSGEIRVYMGSTNKLGVGANVQRRLFAMHAMDAPWRPADVEQRYGRGIRQGNLNPEVHIYRYVTERSFDGFMWQTLERKAAFLSDIMSGARGSRIVEDIDNPLPDAAQMKAAASGDPRILEHAELSRDVRNLASQQRAHEQTKSQAQWQLNNNKSNIELYEKQLPVLQADAGRVKDLSGDKFVVDLGGKAFTKRAEAGAAILAKLREIDPRTFYAPKVIKLGTMGGFDMNIEVQAGWSEGGTHLKATPILTGESGYASANDTVINEHTDAGGLIRRFENIMAGIKEKPTTLKESIASLKKESDRLSKTVTATWRGEKEYREKQKKLQDLTNELKGGKAVEAESEQDEPQSQRSRNPLEGEEKARTPSGWGHAEGRGEPQGQKVRLSEGVYAYVKPAYTAKETEIANAVAAIGAKMAPKATVQAASALRQNGATIWGSFVNNKSFPQLIAWSLEKGDARQVGQTVRHEIIHHLRNTGLFKPAEWAALRDAAVNEGWLKSHKIEDRYPDLSDDHKVEEAVAEQFGKWRSERSLVKPGLIRDAFMRLDLFLRRVAAAVRKAMGFKATPADIFTRIETGEVGRREPVKRASGGRIESGTGKRGRDSFGYMEPSPSIPDFAQCGSCQLWIKDRERCHWFSDTKKVEANDSCTEYVQGEPIKGNVKASNSLDPKEAGFIKGSTRCENCVSFDKANSTCKLFKMLNTQPIFDLDEKVKPRACCNAFSRDAARHAKIARRASGGVVSHYIERNPSEAQKEAGNYRKAHINVHGLDIAIENAKGHERSGIGKNGKPWSVTMPAHYGYLKRTEGADGDHVDCYVGRHPKSRRVFIVDQHDAETGRFDEHKCMLGFASEKQARNVYYRGFSDGRGKDRLGHLTEMSIDQFKHWLNGDTKRPTNGTAHSPKIDTSHDVQWMSEMSKDGHVFYRDRSLPAKIINNKKWLSVDEPLKRHEVAEYNAIKKMVADFEAKNGRKPNDAEREAIYLRCHKEHGEAAEHAYLRENGYDVKAWESWCRGKLAHLEHKRVAKPVPNPHVRISPHDRRRLEETVV